MEEISLNKKIKIKNLSFSIKELLLTLPTSYEYKQFLDQHTPIYNDIFYKFVFQKKSMMTKGNKIIMKGLANNIEITVFHSAKLIRFFGANNTITLCGKIEKNTCFFPEILKSLVNSNEISPNYEFFTPSVSKYMLDGIKLLPIKLQHIFQEIHFPTNLNKVNEVLKELMQMEISIFFNLMKKFQKPRNPYKLYDIKSPFELTEEQNEAIEEIKKDFQIPFRSIRVIHGDVGSGKTLLSYLSSMIVAQNNKQVAIMAPTGLLAQQIYDFFIQNNYLNLNISLVTALKGKKVDIESFKQCNIIIGTHALLYNDYVTNLGLLIIDEQHKFGVNQRNKLIGDSAADVLMLTATPIPRTFKMMSDGYIKFSMLKNVPIGGNRKTIVISSTRMNEVFAKMFDIAKTNKVIWICKTIELSEERLAIFSKYCENVLIVHGKIKEKNDILKEFDAFTNGVLISTTVIEVGIDIDVSFIFIEEADMFGLAQLHQMRGRVGRRNKDGYCILIGKNINKLKQIKLSGDGFSITELDTSKRGGGIIHGIEQSGFKSFKFCKMLQKGKVIDYEIDEEIISESKKIIIEKDIVEFLGIEGGEISA